MATKEAIHLAEIIMDGRTRLLTSFGTKMLAELAEMIDQELNLPGLLVLRDTAEKIVMASETRDADGRFTLAAEELSLALPPHTIVGPGGEYTQRLKD